MKKYFISTLLISCIAMPGAVSPLYSQVADSSGELSTPVNNESTETISNEAISSEPESSQGDLTELVLANVPAVQELNTQTPIQIKLIDLRTPYSLQDCLNLSQLGIDHLVEARGDMTNVNLNAMKDLLDAVADYLQERDDLHSNLMGYDWEEIGRHQVRNSNNNTYSYIFPKVDVPTGVTALSFEVERADSNLKRVEVYNSEGELVGPWSNEMTLRHSFPRRYVYHLYQPTDVKTLRITASQVKPDANRTPQIVVRAGRSDKKEHGKLAIYSILQTEVRLAEGDLKSALETLQVARQEIEIFRKHSRR